MFFILVVLGGALGGLARYLLTKAVSILVGERFPWGTLLVNGLGSFLLGAFLGASVMPEGQSWEPTSFHVLFVTGFCGGLTTFSAFSLETMALMTRRRMFPAFANILGSVLLCLFAGASGYALMEVWSA